MIAFLEGKVLQIGSESIVLRIGGIGYEIYCSNISVEIGETISFYIYEHIREDRRDLYGFAEVDALNFFKRLIDINGVGTKLAMKILRSGSVSKIFNTIAKGDLETLILIPGVGKKLAQKIILELKGVLVEIDVNLENNDVLDALLSLGYSRNDYRSVSGLLKSDSVEGQIKEALKILGSHG